VVRIGFRTKLMVIMGVFSLLLTFTISFIDQKRLYQSLIEEREVQKSLIQDNIITSISSIDKAYQVLDSDLETKMLKYSTLLGEQYKSNPNFDDWNFEQLKQDFEGMDIYIINRDLVITHSSYKTDVGIDFKLYPKFSENLMKIMDSSQFVADNMDLETLTGNLRKYSYYPTHDQNYIIELGFPLTNNKLFEMLSFLKVTEQLEKKYSMVDEITVYTEDGLALGKLTPDGNTLYLDKKYSAILERSGTNSEGKTVVPNADNPNIIHEFAPYIIGKKTDQTLKYADFRMVEIVYNESLFNQILKENKKIFILQLALTVIIAFFISYTIARLVAKPMYLAFHDLLTGLANRASFQTKLEESFKYIAKNKSQFAVLTLDLDNFKRVNDTLGHDGGDLLLMEYAKRIKAAIGSSAFAARLGGDEFAIILTGFSVEKQAVEIAERILSESTKPILINGKDVVKEVGVTTSIGIAIAPVHGEDSQTIYKNADRALYYAKHSGKNVYKIFDWELVKESD